MISEINDSYKTLVLYSPSQVPPPPPSSSSSTFPRPSYLLTLGQSGSLSQPPFSAEPEPRGAPSSFRVLPSRTPYPHALSYKLTGRPSWNRCKVRSPPPPLYFYGADFFTCSDVSSTRIIPTLHGPMLLIQWGLDVVGYAMGSSDHIVVQCLIFSNVVLSLTCFLGPISIFLMCFGFVQSLQNWFFALFNIPCFSEAIFVHHAILPYIFAEVFLQYHLAHCDSNYFEPDTPYMHQNVYIIESSLKVYWMINCTYIKITLSYSKISPLIPEFLSTS